MTQQTTETLDALETKLRGWIGREVRLTNKPAWQTSDTPPPFTLATVERYGSFIFVGDGADRRHTCDGGANYWPVLELVNPPSPEEIRAEINTQSDVIASLYSELIAANEREAEEKKAAEGARFPLPEGWEWGTSDSGNTQATNGITRVGVNKDGKLFQTRRATLDVVSAVIARYEAENAPPVDPPGYVIEVGGRNSTSIYAECPEIQEGDTVKLTLDDGREISRALRLHASETWRTDRRYRDTDDSWGTLVSGSLFGVAKIELIKRAEKAPEPYSVQLDGKTMREAPHEFKAGDRVRLDHSDGRSTEHKITRVFPEGHTEVRPHCGPSSVNNVINISCNVTKITRLEG